MKHQICNNNKINSLFARILCFSAFVNGINHRSILMYDKLSWKRNVGFNSNRNPREICISVRARFNIRLFFYGFLEHFYGCVNAVIACRFWDKKGKKWHFLNSSKNTDSEFIMRRLHSLDTIKSHKPERFLRYVTNDFLHSDCL